MDTPVGYIASGRMHYYIRDHQGNVRQVTDSDGNVEQDNHYYPYGGKEYLTTGGANLLDFTARTYDPTILLFHTPDPLRDKYLPVHSYLYCGANPIMFTDPTDMKLQLSGSKEDIITTIRVYEKYTGCKLKFSVNETGIVSVQPCSNTDMKFSEAQEQCANVMMRVIEDNNLTSINIVNNSESIAIADAVSSTIDIGDITALGDNYHVTSGYTLVHETWEQYKLQNGDIKSIGTKTDKDFL